MVATATNAVISREKAYGEVSTADIPSNRRTSWPSRLCSVCFYTRGGHSNHWGYHSLGDEGARGGVMNWIKILFRRKPPVVQDQGTVVYREPDGLGRILEIKIY